MPPRPASPRPAALARDRASPVLATARRAGWAVRHGIRLAWLWVAAVLVALPLGAGLLALALSEAPVSLPPPLVARIAAQLNAGLPAGQISLGGVEVALAPGRLSRLRLRDVGIRDASGAPVARLNAVDLGLSLPALLHGRLAPRTLALAGAQATLRRRADGSFDLSFGDTGGLGGSWPQLLDRIDGLFVSGPLAGLERIEASDLTLSLEDARSGRVWQVTGGRLVLTQDAQALRLAVEAEVFNGTEDLARVSAVLHSDKTSGAASAELDLANVSATDIALQGPALAFLAALDAPLGGRLTVSVDAQGRLDGLGAELTVGAGELSSGAGAPRAGAGPDPSAEPVAAPLAISGGELHLAYDPARGEIAFERLGLRTALLDVALTGRAWLREVGPDGWPASFEGQFELLELALHEDAPLAGPLHLEGGSAELRLRLAPLRLDVGRLQLGTGRQAVTLSGRAALGAAGPELAFEARAAEMDLDRALALWPPAMGRAARDWVAAHVSAARLSDLHLAFARAPGARNRLALGFDFADTDFHWLAGASPIVGASGYASLAEDRFAVVAEGGRLLAPAEGPGEGPEGGPAEGPEAAMAEAGPDRTGIGTAEAAPAGTDSLDIAGSVFTLPDLRARPLPARVELAARGPLPAALAVLDGHPFGFLRKAGLGTDLAEGQVAGTVSVALPLRSGLTPPDIDWHARAQLDEVGSHSLAPGRQLTGTGLQLTADPAELRIAGPAALDGLPFDLQFHAALGPAPEGEEPAPLRVLAEAMLDQAALDAFGVALPAGMVAGAAPAQVTLEFPPDGPPRFRLDSDLEGLRLRLPALDYAKPPASRGSLALSGTLGAPPSIDALRLEAPGLSLAGHVTLDADGGFASATFDRVRLGGWLDAPVTVRARGAAAPAIAVTGGTLDFRKAPGGGGGGGATQSGPLSVALDRLIVAEGLELTGLRGEFAPQRAGYSGSFTAKLNGGNELTGTLVPQEGGTALRLASQNAGAVLRDSGMAERIRGGAMELRLTPTGQPGVYEGQLSAERLRVRGTPALAELMNAVSVVGLLQQLNGDGIVFDRANARFRLSPGAIDIREASASGASMGISARGRIALGSGALDLDGVFSPVFLLNGIGQALTRPGEGLFGVTYRLTGTSAEPKVSGNPLSILTPGMFREIFRGPPPAASR